MTATETPLCDFGRPAHDFELPGVDGKTYSLADCAGPKGTLVMFICNHCPFVQAILDRLIRDTRALREAGVYSVALMSNDVVSYPADAPDRMRALATEKEFPFPYLYDETQEVAKAYGAVCTPDFFGYDADLRLQYRGRLDASGRAPAPAGARRELYEAMLKVAQGGEGPAEQHASVGCSIKWR